MPFEQLWHIITKCFDVLGLCGILRILVAKPGYFDQGGTSAEQVPHFLMDVSETRRYIKNLRGENRALKLEILEYQKENARLQDLIKTLETQAVENLKEQGIIK